MSKRIVAIAKELEELEEKKQRAQQQQEESAAAVLVALESLSGRSFPLDLSVSIWRFTAGCC